MSQTVFGGLRRRVSFLAAAAVALWPAASPVRAESSALLDLLVKKGVLSENEAASVQEESKKVEQQQSANKLKLANSLQELRLSGDVRMRYQYDNRDFQVDPAPTGNDRDRSPSGNQNSRVRLRLRLNADFKLSDHWFGGVELQTGYASDSANQTFENGFADYPIFISRAFLGYSPTDWLNFSAGKLPNPFYTTELVYDPDINPSGFVEQIAFHKLWASHAESMAGYSKDGKAVAPKAPPSPWELTLVAGQFVFDDNVEGGGRDPGGTDNDETTDAWLFQTQLIVSYAFSKEVKLTVAPTWMVYNAGTVGVPSALTTNFGDFNNNSFSDNALVNGATRHLNIINAPGEIAFKLGSVRTKLYWDFAYNLEGKSRAEDIYRLLRQRNAPGDADDFQSNHRRQDDFAWLVGLQFGENRKKGDLSFLANWRQTGISSVDPNLNDNEFALGELNTKGVRLAVNYNFAEFAVFSVNYYYAWNLHRDLVGGEATAGNSIADGNQIQVLQVDLNVKF